MRTKYEIDDLKSRVDLVELAGRYTTLHRVTAREMAGPCPMPGCSAKTDGFHVHADGWWTCYTCHPHRHYDVFDFLHGVLGVDFNTAYSMLGGADLPPPPVQRTPAPKQQKQSRELPDWAADRLAMAQQRLRQPEGQAARDYLLGRGFQPHTWQVFHLGFELSAPVPGTEGEQRAPAIALPWYDKGRLSGIRYRFLEVQNGHKLTSAPGSRFAGLLYGEHALNRAELGRTLVICEGELNDLSIWQVAHATRLDVLSLGSESQRITPEMVAWIERTYSTVITWLDRRDLAIRVARLLPGAAALPSPNGQDANDLLQSGDLSYILGALRLRLAQSDDARRELYLDYQRALMRDGGAEAGTVWTGGELAKLIEGDMACTSTETVSESTLRASPDGEVLDAPAMAPPEPPTPPAPEPQRPGADITYKLDGVNASLSQLQELEPLMARSAAGESLSLTEGRRARAIAQQTGLDGVIRMMLMTPKKGNTYGGEKDWALQGADELLPIVRQIMHSLVDHK